MVKEHKGDSLGLTSKSWGIYIKFYHRINKTKN